MIHLSEIQIRFVGASSKLPPVIWKISAHWFYYWPI